MKYVLCVFFTIFFLGGVCAQEVTADSLLMELNLPEEPDHLLPEKMLFTQRMLWGEKGLYRKVGIAPKEITIETREKELKVRRTMFRVHQAMGIATAAGMLVQGYLGTRIYNPETYTTRLKNLHEGMATGLNIGYATTALMSFTAPPAAVYRKKFDNIKLHRILSYVHLSGMITTNVLASRIDRNFQVNKKLHRGVAFTTFGAYAAAIATIKLEF